MFEASFLCDAQGSQGVGGLTGLGDGDEQAPFRHHELAIAELGGDLNVAGDAGEFLDPVSGDTAGVVRRAAGGDGDGARAVEHRAGVDAECRLEHARTTHATFQGIAHGLRLFVNLLVHVVAVVAAIGIARVGGDAKRGANGGLVLQIPHRDASRREFDEVSFLQDEEAVGNGSQRRHVRRDEVLANAEADHERAADAHGDDAAWVIGGNHGQRECTFKSARGLAHRVAQLDLRVAAETVVHQMGDHFGVRVRLEPAPSFLELFAQAFVVLDDAVVDERNATAAGDVRVGIADRGDAVGGPARVGDAGDTSQRCGHEGIVEFLHVGRPFADVRCRSHQRWPCRPSRSRDTPAGAARQGESPVPDDW